MKSDLKKEKKKQTNKQRWLAIWIWIWDLFFKNKLHLHFQLNVQRYFQWLLATYPTAFGYLLSKIPQVLKRRFSAECWHLVCISESFPSSMRFAAIEKCDDLLVPDQVNMMAIKQANRVPFFLFFFFFVECSFAFSWRRKIFFLLTNRRWFSIKPLWTRCSWWTFKWTCSFLCCLTKSKWTILRRT